MLTIFPSFNFNITSLKIVDMAVPGTGRSYVAYPVNNIPSLRAPSLKAFLCIENRFFPIPGTDDFWKIAAKHAKYFCNRLCRGLTSKAWAKIKKTCG